MSVICPGLGHIYAAAPRRGWRFIGAVLAFEIVAGILPQWPPSLPAAVAEFALIVAWIALLVFIIYDAIRTARRGRISPPGRLDRAWAYVGLALGFVVVSQVLFSVEVRSRQWKPYRMPSGSMLPGIAPGEFMMAWRGYFETHAPRRGDLAILGTRPDPNLVYVKRIIGLPGDRVQLVENRLRLNGEDVPTERRPGPPGEGSHGRRVERRVESLPEGRTYEIFVEGSNGPSANTAEFVVPPHHVFVLGDDRDDSYDSRWNDFGMVPLSAVTDLPRFLYWSPEWSRVGRQLE